MLFHAFGRIYTVLDCHAKHGQSFKTRVGVFSVPKILFQILTGFRVFFSSMGLSDVNGGEIPCTGASPGRARAHTSTRAREQEHAHQHVFGFTEVVGRAAQVKGLHEINIVTKEVCFWLWGKDNLASQRTQWSWEICAHALHWCALDICY